MKKVTVFILILLCLKCPAQITQTAVAKKTTIGEVRQGGRFMASLYYLVSGEDTLHTIMYQNRQFERIADVKQIQFMATAKDLDSLYRFLKDVQTTGTETGLTLGSTWVKVSKPKGFGGAIRIGSGDGFFYLTANQLKKLFAKDR